MTHPAISAQQLLTALLLGLGLGLCYGFLRPLYRIGNWLRDLLFLPCILSFWVYLGFGICGGDLRLGYFTALAAGALLWECTIGRLLRPLFFGFWGGIFHIFTFLSHCLKKFFKKWLVLQKKYLHLGKNRVQ